MTSAQVDDARARDLAIDPRRSILLQAPAGSGKTTVLVLRFLTLLASVQEPEEVLAITFTRKAAAEMRERVQHALQGELDPHSPNDVRWIAVRERVLAHARQRGWSLLELPLRLRIQTIDSLNQYLASQRADIAGATARLQVMERARPLHERAARRTLFDAERDPELRDSMGMILERLDNRWERAEQLIADLLERRAQWLPRIFATPPEQLAERVAASLRAIAAEVLQRSSGCIAAHLRDEVHALASASAQQRAALQAPGGEWEVWLEPPAALGDDPLHLAHWRAFADLSLTQTGMWRKEQGITRREGFPPTARSLKARFVDLLAELERLPDARQCLIALRDLPPLAMQNEDAVALAGLARILKLAAAELELEFAAAGRVDYTMVAASARAALGDADAPSELAMRFGTGLKHLLVDEFQDTSVEQFALLEALVAGWQEGDGRSLFLVGDPMQSIYLFRAAEVGLFLRARERGIGGLRLQSLALTRNFRSLPDVTHWVNATFVRLLPEHDDVRTSAVRFLSAEPAAGERPGEVRVHALPTPDVANEAQRVVGIVRAARARDRSVTIAVLVVSRGHAVATVAALRTSGIAVRGIDLEPLGTRPSVRDLTALTSALLRPADRPAWLALLRAPWCGLSLTDLTTLCGNDPDGLIPDLLRAALADDALLDGCSSEGRQAVRRCAPLLLAGCDDVAPDLATRVESTWLRLGGPATCADDAALCDAERFLLALHAQQSEATLDEAAIGRLGEALFAQGESDARDAVEVLTIHRAKGLEWDVVVLPGLGRTTRPDDSPLLRWIELPRGDDGTDLLMATLSLGNPGNADPLNRYIAQLHRERGRNEKVRLAYVAVTRARRELHLLGHAPVTQQGGSPMPPANSMLRVLWPALESRFLAALAEDAAAGAMPPPDAQPTPAVQYLERLAPDWRAPPLPEDVRVVGLPLANERIDVVPEYSWVGQTARAVGTVVHAELERIGREALWPPLAHPDARRRFDTALRQLGVEAAARPRAVERVAAALAKTRVDPRAGWLFDPGHAERFAELRLTGLVAGALVNVIIDRSFIDAEGVRWVIDFKTSTHEGADLDAFLASEAERYAVPMQRYVQLARLLGPQPVRAALYFPLLGAFREL